MQPDVGLGDRQDVSDEPLARFAPWTARFRAVETCQRTGSPALQAVDESLRTAVQSADASIEATDQTHVGESLQHGAASSIPGDRRSFGEVQAAKVVSCRQPKALQFPQNCEIPIRQWRRSTPPCGR